MKYSRNHHRTCRNRREVLEYLGMVSMAKLTAKAGMSGHRICRSGLSICANDWDWSKCL